MKKILIAAVFLIVFCVGFLSGFLYGRLPGTTSEPLDTDGDGFEDTIDDGPYDVRYHEKNKTAEIEFNVAERWTTEELAPRISSNYTGVMISLYTSGPDIVVELFTKSYGNITSVWNYSYNGLDPTETHDHFYFFSADEQEQFYKLVLTNPAPDSSFNVLVVIYAIR